MRLKTPSEPPKSFGGSVPCSRNDTDHKTAIDIGALVGEVVKLTAGEAAIRNVSVQVQASPSVRRVIGDGIQLQQCMLNLIMNAFDAITEAKSDQRGVTIKVAPEKTGWAAYQRIRQRRGHRPCRRDPAVRAIRYHQERRNGIGAAGHPVDSRESRRQNLGDAESRPRRHLHLHPARG